MVGTKDPRAGRALSYLQDHYSGLVSFNQLASSLNISPSRLRALIKAQTGITATRYIKLVRLQKAQQLLQSTFMSVKEIVFEVGLNDQSHFIRDFKRVFGMSPGRFRRTVHQQEVELIQSTLEVHHIYALPKIQRP